MGSNLASIIWNQSAITPKRNFIEGINRSYSYSQAKSAIGAMAESLLSRGIEKGDRIMIVSSNNPETLLLFMACYAIGAIAILLHEDSTIETISYIEKEANPALIYVDEQLQYKTNSLVNQVITLDYEFRDKQDENCFQPVSVPEKTPAFIVYTSGSTGKPKGVTLTHQNVLFVITAIQKRLNYQTNDIVGLFIPLSFDYGLYQAFLCAQVGATVLLRNSTFTGPILPSLIEKYQLTVLPGLPNLFETLITIAQRRNMSLTSLKKITNTGSHLPSSFIGELQKIAPNAEVYPMYGLTECKRVSILLPEEVHARPGSCGRPLDGTQAWVVREDGSHANVGEVGELVVKGPHVSLGYWNSPSENEKRFKTDDNGDALLFTGDHFTQDKDGYLYYVSRMDEQIKRNGFRINRMEIEETALDLEGINNAVLIQSPKKLILFLTADNAMSPTEVMTALMGKLETYKIPDEIRFVEAIKTTKNGKVDSRAMEALV